MKSFRVLLVLSFFFIQLFNSCKKDNSQDGMVDPQDCQVTQVSDFRENKTFTYDSQGLTTKVTGQYYGYVTYTYAVDKIVKKVYSPAQGVPPLVFNIIKDDQGRIVNLTCPPEYRGWKEDTATFTYNADGYIGTAILPYYQNPNYVQHTYKFTYKAGNLDKVEVDADGYYADCIYQFTYKSDLAQNLAGYLSPINILFDQRNWSFDPDFNLEPLLAMFGKASKNLVSGVEKIPKQYSNAKAWTRSYVYTKDVKGNISTVKVTNVGEGGINETPAVETYNFVYNCK